jgi:hypothetical protein
MTAVVVIDQNMILLFLFETSVLFIKILTEKSNGNVAYTGKCFLFRRPSVSSFNGGRIKDSSV